MLKRRPVMIDLNPFHFPLPALASILHRLSGVFLFFLIPCLLWGLQHSLASEQQFETLKANLAQPLSLWLLWFCLCAFGYHLLAGIRHLLMDMHVGESKRGGTIGALSVLCLVLVLAICLGINLWVH